MPLSLVKSLGLICGYWLKNDMHESIRDNRYDNMILVPDLQQVKQQKLISMLSVI